jgi:hypothetical protein
MVDTWLITLVSYMTSWGVGDGWMDGWMDGIHDFITFVCSQMVVVVTIVKG